MIQSVPYAVYQRGWSVRAKPAEIVTIISSIPAGLIALIGGVKVSAAMSFMFSANSANGIARGIGAVWFVAAILAIVGMARSDYNLEIVGVRLLSVAYFIYGLAGMVAALWGGVGSALTGVLSLSVAVWLSLKATGLAHERSRELHFKELQVAAGKWKQENSLVAEGTEDHSGS